MNYFLVLILILLSCGGYYEYTALQQKQADLITANQKQIEDLNAQIGQLNTDKKKLQDDLAAANKNLGDTKSRLADITGKLQAMQKAADDAKKAALEAASPGGGQPSPTASRNYLGTIAALNGKTFQNCKLLKVNPDSIVFSYADGITQLAFILLPPDLEKRFGFDPHRELQLTPEEVQVQESLRMSADLPSAGR